MVHAQPAVHPDAVSGLGQQASELDSTAHSTLACFGTLSVLRTALSGSNTWSPLQWQGKMKGGQAHRLGRGGCALLLLLLGRRRRQRLRHAALRMHSIPVTHTS